MRVTIGHIRSRSGRVHRRCRCFDHYRCRVIVAAAPVLIGHVHGVGARREAGEVTARVIHRSIGDGVGEVVLQLTRAARGAHADVAVRTRGAAGGVGGLYGRDDRCLRSRQDHLAAGVFYRAALVHVADVERVGTVGQVEEVGVGGPVGPVNAVFRRRGSRTVARARRGVDHDAAVVGVAVGRVHLREGRVVEARSRWGRYRQGDTGRGTAVARAVAHEYRVVAGGQVRELVARLPFQRGAVVDTVFHTRAARRLHDDLPVAQAAVGHVVHVRIGHYRGSRGAQYDRRSVRYRTVVVGVAHPYVVGTVAQAGEATRGIQEAAAVQAVLQRCLSAGRRYRDRTVAARGAGRLGKVDFRNHGRVRRVEGHDAHVFYAGAARVAHLHHVGTGRQVGKARSGLPVGTAVDAVLRSHRRTGNAAVRSRHRDLSVRRRTGARVGTAHDARVVRGHGGNEVHRTVGHVAAAVHVAGAQRVSTGG